LIGATAGVEKALDLRFEMSMFPSLNRIVTDFEGSPSAARGGFCGQFPGFSELSQKPKKAD
jgi:hypothetical protein